MTPDRVNRAIKALVELFTEQTKCHVKVRYRVISKSVDRYNLQALRKGDWPDLVPCAVAPGVSGCQANLTLGSIVLVEFVEGDPAIPRITAFEEPGQPGFVPISLAICPPGAAAARVGDVVQALVAPGPITGTITIGGTPSPFAGTFATPLTIVGTIQTGSTKVSIG